LTAAFMALVPLALAVWWQTRRPLRGAVNADGGVSRKIAGGPISIQKE